MNRDVATVKAMIGPPVSKPFCASRDLSQLFYVAAKYSLHRTGGNLENTAVCGFRLTARRRAGRARLERFQEKTAVG
jgi:hypothetical protein